MRRVARAMFVAAVLGFSIFGVVATSEASGAWSYDLETGYCVVQCDNGLFTVQPKPSATACKAFCVTRCGAPCSP
jgi:hypothetical protein